MENQKQQLKNYLWKDNHCKMVPDTTRGDIYLSIVQDLAQAVIVVDSNYYNLLDDD